MEIKVEQPQFLDKNYNILDFGEINENPEINQKTIQYAIDTISQMGGGHLVLNPGIIECGPIELKSNIDLVIPRNCYLKFVKDHKFYKPEMFNYEGKKAIRCNSPIKIWNCENVAITGDGIIDGCGFYWRPCKDWKINVKEKEAREKISTFYVKTKESMIWYPTESSYLGSLKGIDNITLEESDQYWDLFRPVLISIYKSNKVLLKDITSSNSPAWNIHPLFSTNLTFDSIKVKNEYSAQNGDGIDIESCKNVLVFNSVFEVGDDGICIKSGKNREARLIKGPSENIYIHDNLVYHAHGGIVIGSEMSRGVKNVFVSNNSFIGTDVGIRFKSAIGRGGVVEDIHLDNIYMSDIKEEAIIFDLGYSLYKMDHENSDDVEAIDNDDIPYFQNITMSNMVSNGSKVFLKIRGINPLTVKNIHIENVSFKSKEFLDLNNCSNVRLKNVYNNEDILIEDNIYNK